MQNPHLAGEEFIWKAGATGILLSHGLTATTAEVRPLARDLFEAGYTVAGPLLPGHGSQPLDANRYSWKDWTATISTSYQSLRQECQQVFIGGESLGGLLALYQAQQSPEIDGLLLYAPILKFRQPVIKVIAPLLSPFIKLVNKPKVAPDASDSLWQGYTVYPLPAVVQLLRLQKVVLDHLSHIHQPLLVVMGSRDRSVHPDTATILASHTLSAHKKVYWMQQSGHCVILDCERQTVAQITLDFIKSIS